MNALIGILLLLGSWGQEVSPLEKAYQSHEDEDYALSIKYYQEALKLHPENSANIRYNIGQCYMKMDSSEKALSYFYQLLAPEYGSIGSYAANNMGIIQLSLDRFKEALASFRQAMELDPENEYARYNYELLRKKMNDFFSNQKPPGAPSPPNPRDQEDDQEEQDQDEPQTRLPSKEYQELIEQIRRRIRKPSTDDRGEPVGNDTISLTQAKRLLEAMRQDETQFLQQLRKTITSPRKNENRPDW